MALRTETVYGRAYFNTDLHKDRFTKYNMYMWEKTIRIVTNTQDDKGSILTWQ